MMNLMTMIMLSSLRKRFGDVNEEWNGDHDHENQIDKEFDEAELKK